MPPIPFIARKTLKINVDAATYDHEELRPFPGWVQSRAEELKYATLTIEVDGKMAFTIPEFRNFEIAPGFLEIDKRLKLMEDVLATADTFGAVLLVRGKGDLYTVYDPTKFTVSVKS